MLDNMIRTLKWMVFFLCISLSACITEDEEMESGNNLEVGDRIPSFSVVMNDGSRVEDEDLLGEVSGILDLTISISLSTVGYGIYKNRHLSFVSSSSDL